MSQEKTNDGAVGPGTVAAPSEPTVTQSAPSSSEQRNEFDPLGWTVPVICKDCGKGFELPYRHFQVGVVFHCPHCHGSFVPNLPMYRAVRDAFERFYGKRSRDRDAFEHSRGDATAFHHRQKAELEEFRKSLDQLAQEMRPAGKMVKRKGLAAMFT
jgi:hypothetical protein